MENPNFSKFQALVKEFSPPLYDFISLTLPMSDSNGVRKVEKGGIKDFLSKFKKPFSIAEEKFSLEGILAEIKKIYHQKAIGKICKKKWRVEDKYLLLWTTFYYLKLKKLNSYDELDKSDWKEIATLVKRDDDIECAFKFHSLLLSSFQTKEWSPEEDRLLSEIVKGNLKKSSSIKWSFIAKELYIKKSEKFKYFRNEKICRERWIYYLDPHLKNTKWTNDEDKVLINEYLAYGSKWSKISKKLRGRNCYSIKNRFDLICRRLKLCNKKDNEEKLQKLLKEAYKKENIESSDNSAQIAPNELQSPQNTQTEGIDNLTPQTLNNNIFNNLFQNNMVFNNPYAPLPSPQLWNSFLGWQQSFNPFLSMHLWNQNSNPNFNFLYNLHNN